MGLVKNLLIWQTIFIEINYQTLPAKANAKSCYILCGNAIIQLFIFLFSFSKIVCSKYESKQIFIL